MGIIHDFFGHVEKGKCCWDGEIGRAGVQDEQSFPVTFLKWTVDVESEQT